MKRRYGISEALNMVLLPDGSLSNFDDDDGVHSGDKGVPINCQEFEEEYDKDVVCGSKEQIAVGGLHADMENRDEDPGESQEPNDSIELQPIVGRSRKSKCRWRKVIANPLDIPSDFTFSDPPADTIKTYQYFKTFVTDDLMKHISEQTNLYAMQKEGKELGVTTHDI